MSEQHKAAGQDAEFRSLTEMVQLARNLASHLFDDDHSASNFADQPLRIDSV